MTSTRGTRPAIGLAAYGFGYLCGFAGAGTTRANPDPYDAYALMDLAAAHDLAGVEFPPRNSLPSMEPAELARARAYAEARGLFIVADTGVIDVDDLTTMLPAAAALGAKAVRVVASGILCGDRRAVRDTWSDYLSELTARLRAIRPLAEDLGVSVGVENHQDLTSAELLAMCEAVDSPRIGVTLDAINPLAVGEDPLVFAHNVAPFVKNVHLKDYFVYSTHAGFRLVRSSIGAGVLNVRGLFDLLATEAPEATIAIELGALEARHVRFLEDEFWPGYPPRRIEEVLPVLRLRETRSRPKGEDWRTPWERGQHGDALAAFELSQFQDSVEYLQRMEG